MKRMVTTRFACFTIVKRDIANRALHLDCDGFTHMAVVPGPDSTRVFHECLYTSSTGIVTPFFGRPATGMQHTSASRVSMYLRSSHGTYFILNLGVPENTPIPLTSMEGYMTGRELYLVLARFTDFFGTTPISLRCQLFR